MQLVRRDEINRKSHVFRCVSACGCGFCSAPLTARTQAQTTTMVFGHDPTYNSRLVAFATRMSKKAAKVRRQAAAEAAAEPAPAPRTVEALAREMQLRIEKARRERDRDRQAPRRFVPAMMRSDSTKSLVTFKPGVPSATGSRLIDLELLQQFVMPRLRCTTCRSTGHCVIDASKEQRRGLASILHVHCRKCKQASGVLPTSKQLPSAKRGGFGLMEINLRDRASKGLVLGTGCLAALRCRL